MNSVSRPEKETRWLNCLLEVYLEAEKLGAKCFLDNGTLLGAVREKAFIAWDSDIDLGLVVDDHNQDVGKKLSAEVYNLGYNVEVFDAAIYITKAPDIIIGIQLYRLDGGYYTGVLRKAEHRSKLAYLLRTIRRGRIVSCRGFSWRHFIKRGLIRCKYMFSFIPIKFLDAYVIEVERRVVIPSCFFRKLSTFDFYGKRFLVPNDCENYLVCRYGENWEIPVRDYNYITDDHSLRD